MQWTQCHAINHTTGNGLCEGQAAASGTMCCTKDEAAEASPTCPPQLGWGQAAGPAGPGQNSTRRSATRVRRGALGCLPQPEVLFGRTEVLGVATELGCQGGANTGHMATALTRAREHSVATPHVNHCYHHQTLRSPVLSYSWQPPQHTQLQPPDAPGASAAAERLRLSPGRRPWRGHSQLPNSTPHSVRRIG